MNAGQRVKTLRDALERIRELTWKWDQRVDASPDSKKEKEVDWAQIQVVAAEALRATDPERVAADLPL